MLTEKTSVAKRNMVFVIDNDPSDSWSPTNTYKCAISVFNSFAHLLILPTKSMVLSLRSLALCSMSTSDLLHVRDIFAYGLPAGKVTSRIRISASQNSHVLATDTLLEKEDDSESPDPKRPRYHIVRHLLPRTIVVSFFNYKHNRHRPVKFKEFDKETQIDEYYDMGYNYQHMSPDHLEDSFSIWFRFVRGVKIERIIEEKAVIDNS